ncbi:C13 family peptidase, partial [Moraxella catarrhalis]|uniref:C13 family peptidase n=1 Tax=Moraxella catarrhalis TaxID=480 RepID=UPI001D0DAD7D
MNPDEGAFFLVLSSHGSVDEHGEPIGELAVTNPPLNLRPIEPFWLKSALDKSGIRWRVFVVSACYSGTFINALKDPYTMIITASKADKASFCCTDDADMTYFGRAVFNESLQGSDGVMTAFYDALPK